MKPLAVALTKLIVPFLFSFLIICPFPCFWSYQILYYLITIALCSYHNVNNVFCAQYTFDQSDTWQIFVGRKVLTSLGISAFRGVRMLEYDSDWTIIKHTERSISFWPFSGVVLYRWPLPFNSSAWSDTFMTLSNC